MTTHNDLLIRKAETDDIASIVELFSLCLRHEGGSPTEQFWKWKHLKNPFGPSPVLLAFHQQQLIGLRAFLRWQWLSGDKVFHAYRAVDTATHPNFQGRGVFKKLTLQLWTQVQQEEPGSFVFNTPNDQSRPGYLKMGWQILGKPCARFRYVPGLGLSRQRRWQQAIENLSSFSFRNNNMHSSCSHSPALHTNATNEYYTWRYQQIPDRQYGFSPFETNDGVVGFIYYLRNRRGFTELRICDELVFEGTNQSGHLINKGVELLSKHFAGCVVTRLCRPGQSGSDLLAPFIPNITLKLPETSFLMPVDISSMYNWHFEMGTLELF